MPSSPSSPEDARLAALSKELEAAVSRINALQGGGGGAKAGGAAGSAESSNQAAGAASTPSSSSSSSREPPLRARASSHLARHGNRLTSALLAGCAFAVAAGRLSDAWERREAEAGWEAERLELVGRAEAAEAALREAMLRMGSGRGGGGGGEGGEGGGGGGTGGSSSSRRWRWLPSSSSAEERGGGDGGGESPLSSPSPPPRPPPPPKPRMI